MTCAQDDAQWVKVWTTQDRHGHVHRTTDCHGFKTAEKRTAAPPVEVELSSLRHPVPCRWCFPDAPRLKVWHPVCRKCKQARPLPCPHNGGVQVWVPRVGYYTGQGEYDPDLLVHHRKWVWAESAWRYSLVNPSLANPSEAA